MQYTYIPVGFSNYYRQSERETEMALFALDGQRMTIGDYVSCFERNRLLVYLHSDLEHHILILETEDALDLTEWLAIDRKRLYDATMRVKVDTFKARVCAEYGLAEKGYGKP